MLAKATTLLWVEDLAKRDARPWSAAGLAAVQNIVFRENGQEYRDVPMIIFYESTYFFGTKY